MYLYTYIKIRVCVCIGIHTMCFTESICLSIENQNRNQEGHINKENMYMYVCRELRCPITVQRPDALAELVGTETSQVFVIVC